MNKNQIVDSGQNRQNIRQGCILASIAHAIFVANNPDFAYELRVMVIITVRMMVKAVEEQ